ncbi:hypothetical protein DPMN_056939 [Dreissena polymorpha]|uniref:Uncharacterized protein n=1 Tax=Dreissena polymorpha TaxID=45954 RepID=A0A9D4CSM9_DREPO|nr:hypothetical protein DPMN_056939 [Dreissena polymorpha]
MALRRHIGLLACVAHWAEKSAKFRRYQTPTPRDNRDFRLLLWGNGANTGQLAYLRRHFHTGSDGTETPYWTFGMRGPLGPKKSAKFRRYQTPTPRDNRDFRLLLWGNGANTGQLAYLRRHFHRKRWH